MSLHRGGLGNWAVRRRQPTGETPDAKRHEDADAGMDGDVVAADQAAPAAGSAATAAGELVEPGAEVAAKNQQKGKKGKGKGKNDLLDTTAKLTRALADQVRDLNAATFDVLTLGAKDPLAVLINEAGRSYHEATKGQSPQQHLKGPPSIHLFAALLGDLKDRTNKPDHKNLHDALEQLAGKMNTAQEAAMMVRVCKLTKAYDKQKLKLTLALADRSAQHLVTQTLDALNLATPLHGKAPRGGLERQLNNLLS